MGKKRRGSNASVSVVTVTYRTGIILSDCLAALLDHGEIVEIIVVDNGNPPDTTDLLDRLAEANPTVRLIRPGRNIGFAAGCNSGAAKATGRYLAFVNPDLIVPPGSFDRILAAFAGNGNAWLCGGRLLNMDGSEQRGGRREVLTPWRAFVELTRLDRLAPAHPHFRRLHLMDGRPPHEVTAVPIISGAFMVMPRSRFTALGGMDEHMFLHMEDVDLCLRVLLQGGTVLYCGDTPVYHQRGTSTVTRGFVEWHKTRSTIHYFFKHFRAAYPGWSLYLISGLLLLRWGLVTAAAVPSDLAGLMRRARAAKAR
ncbi:MAG: glycosyltransferase family 2 protein [Magnetospirillum sp.]|nr:MAG: glycosyltransferase family 2 protein [Magnetospirillum sp.]